MTGRYERDLVNRFRALGWYAQRGAASGSATEAALPDVLAAKAFPDGSTARWAIELKTSTPANSVYVREAELVDLLDIHWRSGFIPKVALRWKQDTNFYLRSPDAECYWTDSGNLRFRAEGRTDWTGEILRKPRDGGLTNTDLPTASDPIEVW